MLLRLAYFGVANAFAMLRLLPMSDPDKTVEILALRHQITVLCFHFPATSRSPDPMVVSARVTVWSTASRAACWVRWL
ncbi:hypothetical protein ABZT51_36230 [Streptomyces sp. NPDC005373]|uniref:hypothetical protein n=1 Tax=Streptomyces sp. NPDC005373 TaxID=3156879 RepID=UPI0033A1AE6E